MSKAQKIRALAIAIALACSSSAWLHTAAQAAPAGWRCSYTVNISSLSFRYERIREYACYGKSLRTTRANAQARCRQLYNCMAGPCIPNNFVTRSYCER